LSSAETGPHPHLASCLVTSEHLLEGMAGEPTRRRAGLEASEEVPLDPVRVVELHVRLLRHLRPGVPEGRKGPVAEGVAPREGHVLLEDRVALPSGRIFRLDGLATKQGPRQALGQVTARRAADDHARVTERVGVERCWLPVSARLRRNQALGGQLDDQTLESEGFVPAAEGVVELAVQVIAVGAGAANDVDGILRRWQCDGRKI